MTQSRPNDNLNVIIKNADPDSAKKITDILYKLVDDKKINSFKIKNVKKGENSIDLSPFVSLLENIDLELLYENAKESGLFAVGQGLIGIKIIREILGIVKDGIEISEKIKGKESKFGVNCLIKSQSIGKYGRSYNVEPFDTILASAEPDSMKDMFLKERKWGEIKIARARYPLIKYIVIFVKSPISAVTHRGTVSYIQYNPKTGKSMIFLKGAPEKIKPIRYNEKFLHHNAHGIKYTTNERVNNANTLADLYPSLDNQKK